MRNWKKTAIKLLEFLAILLLVIISALVFAFSQDQPPRKTDRVSQQLEKLKNELQLTESQTSTVREILEKDQAQATKDRETFKTNAPGLVEAATNRRQASNSLIEQLLDIPQKEKLKELTRMTPFDRELFVLTEGLLLDDDQQFAVEGILINFYNKLREMAPPGVRGGGEIAPPGYGGSMDVPPGMKGRGMLKDMMKSFHRQKSRAIKKILSKEQEKLYKQLNARSFQADDIP